MFLDAPACETNNPAYEALPGRGRASLYRFSGVQGQEVLWHVAEAACGGDLAHLAAPDNRDELNAIIVAMKAHGISDAFVGVARDNASTEYFLVTGEPAPSDLWRTSQPITANPPAMLTGDGLETVNTNMTNDYICECDGKHPRMFDF